VHYHPSYHRSHRNLVCAIVSEAYSDVLNHAHSPDAALRLKAMQALVWFMSNDTDWIFSFESICHYLQIDPCSIREQVHKLVVGKDSGN
jgi:hypothetical protein